MKKRPYLSIVIAARNDNYGGDFNQRIQNFITWNTNLLEKYKIGTEIIIVNWNPIEENVSLFESLNWPTNRKYVQFKIITVPNKVHLEYINTGIRKSFPLFEYLAKNAGIRRAKGEYILSMNPDILMHPKIFKNSLFKLNKNAFYRVNRVDFKKSILNLKSIKNHCFEIYYKGFKYPINGFSTLKYTLLNFYNSFKSNWRLHSSKYENIFNKKSWKVYYHNAEYKYHCNVSGDFMLMHSNNWFSLNAHPETTKLALHTDALMVVMAGTLGLQEKVLKNPIFHQEHSRRFNAEEKENIEYRAAYLNFQNEAQVMIKEQKPTIYNDDSWGLINFNLPEIEF